MKKCLLSGLLLAMFTSAHADDLATRFDWCADLSQQPEAGQSGRVRLTGEVFDQAYDVHKDLRLLDASDTQWPFYLFIPQDRTVSVEITPNLLNKAFVEGPLPHWSFDLMIPEERAGVVHNRLEVITDGREFVRRVEVFRCEDDPARMAAGYLIQFPDQKSACNRLITYPDSNSSCLRVKVYANARDTQERFELQSIKLYGQTHQPGEMEDVAFQQQEVPERERREQVQTLLLDIGFRNRPVHRIHIETPSPSFVRQVFVFGRNRESDPWTSVGGGAIHRLEEDTQTRIQINAAHRWLKVDIHNKDDAPLDIQALHVEARPYDLVFTALNDRPVRLCFRGRDVPAASYDLKRIRSSQEDRNLPVYTLKPGEPNTPGLSRRRLHHLIRYAAPVSVGAVSLLVIWIIVKMMKRLPGSPP